MRRHILRSLAPTPRPDEYQINAKIGKDGEFLGLDVKIFNDYRLKARYSEKIENGVKDVSMVFGDFEESEQLISKIKTALKDIGSSVSAQDGHNHSYRD
jgi:protein associated with RNAse G/E